MEFEFILPQKNSDLLAAGSGNAYWISKTYDERECAEKLRLARLALTELGTQFIFDFFETFFSVIERVSDLQKQQIFRAIDLLYKAIDQLGMDLADFLPNNNVTTDERNTKLNTLKMLTYAQVTLIKKIDQELFPTSEGAKVGRAKKNAPEDMELSLWDEKRYKALVQLFNLVALPLENLWQPPVAEENFVNLCADLVYRTLEHSSIRRNNVGVTCFEILGTLLKRYNHSLVFPVRIFGILKSCDMAVIAIAQGMVILHEKYHIHTIFKVIIGQILEGLDDSADITVVRNVSTFLTVLGQSAPTLLMPYIREIASDVLSLDSYQLRICILQLMSEIVLSELTGEELTPEERLTRDEYLDHIFYHIHDINAHVRAKAVGLWTHMKNLGAVPLSWLSPVLKVTIGRLEDKSALVRKSSIQLIKSFLERNPFAAKLSLEELETRYKAKHQELSDFRTKMIEEANKMEEVDVKSDEIIVEMKPYVIKCLQQESIEEEGITAEECNDLIKEFDELIEGKRFKRLLLLIRKAEELNGNWKTVQEFEPEHAQLYMESLVKSYFLLKSNAKDYEEDYKKTENAVRFLEDSLEFSRLVVNAVPKLQELLMSRTESDSSEAINFFTSAYLFGIKNTEAGMRQMLYLIWATAKDKREPVREAYKNVLLQSDHNGRAHSVKVVYNLMKFIEGLTFSHYIAFEELIREYVNNNDIDSNMIQVMFEIYTKKLENVTDNEARLALQLLIICSSAKPSIAMANSKLIEEIGFGERGQQDPRIYVQSLEFMMNIYAEKEDQIYSRMEVEHNRVQTVTSLFKKFFMNEKVSNFDDVCSRTFQFIYKMCHQPNIITQGVIGDIWNALMEISDDIGANNLEEELPANEPGLTQTPSSIRPSQNGTIFNTSTMILPSFLLSRFIFLIGYVAMKELIYLDIDIYSNLKYRQDLADLQKNKKKLNAQKANAGRRTTLNMSATAAVRKSVLPQQQNQEDDDNNDDDVIGPSAEDAFAEQINLICEHELLYQKDGIFRKFMPMVLEVLKYPKKFNDQELQRSALLAIIHFMSVSSEFCEKNMHFLMNIFLHSQDIDIKCNVIIGMSDLTFRFPNVIEPWSSHMYSTLHDKNRELRLTSVRILSHLISHEMILIKGQISDLAMCLVDKDMEIKTATEIFFKEIAHKSNILYNVLPDIISRLGDPNLNLEEGKYQIIMRYIIGLISKDRQIENLVDKLCYRFKITEHERQWRDIAFCLSLLSYTEKTIKKLIENIPLFKDKVQVQEVYDFFRNIITSSLKQVNKFSKPEFKTAVQEFETKLEECLAVNDNPNAENEVDANDSRRTNAPIVKRQQTVRGAKNKAKIVQKGRKGRRNVPSSDSESDVEVEKENPQKTKGKPKQRIIESDSDDEPMPRKIAPSRQPIRASRSNRSKVIEELSTSDEDPKSSKKPASKRTKN